MGDMHEAGRKAAITRRANEAREEAHRVRDLVRDRYSNPTKARIRSWIVAEIKAANPSLVLDLWGGGLSAEEMVTAGLPVLSVDRARGFEEHGVTAAQAKSALMFCGQESGYRTGWVSATGTVSKFAHECDAAWWDFMGHLAGDKIRALKASRHMKIIVVTLMADRMAGAEDFTAETWSVMYRAAIDHYSGLRVSVVKKYPRADGHWVLVFIAHRRFDRKGWDRTRNATPERRAKQAAYLVKYRADHIAQLKAADAARWADPLVKKASADYKRRRYNTDAEYRANVLAKQHEYRARRRAEAG